MTIPDVITISGSITFGVWGKVALMAGVAASGGRLGILGKLRGRG